MRIPPISVIESIISNSFYLGTIRSIKQCSQLKRIAFEKGAKLKIIPQSVFANLNSLTAIEIPASIELIEDGAFADCHSLTVITFEKNSNLKAIGNSAFDSD